MSFVSCGSSGSDETPTYVEPTIPQHNAPQWNTVVDVVKPNEKYPTDLTAYIQLPSSISAYSSNADEMAAFCGDEPRGEGNRSQREGRGRKSLLDERNRLRHSVREAQPVQG